MRGPDTISIVGGGWSVKDVDLDAIPGTLIAVNDAAIHLPRRDVIVSMDRLWTEYRFANLRKFAVPTYLRRSAVQNVNPRWPWCHVFDNDNARDCALSEHPNQLNGFNSGVCAINLAYIWRPRRILLFGFDAVRGRAGEKYWYPPYPWSYTTSDTRYAEWADQFALIARTCEEVGIEVLNVSPKSRIKAFRQVRFDDIDERVAAA